ncbi:RNA-directed DNA polymerase, eukaryota, reverse transcriptase zinc-binding domain protein [Tanacetum coccineum]
MHTTMVPEQVKTQKIQAGVQVSRQKVTNVIFSIRSTLEVLIVLLLKMLRMVAKEHDRKSLQDQIIDIDMKLDKGVGSSVVVADRENAFRRNDHRLELGQDASEEEIKKAIWDYGSNKSSGPDGFTFEFYKKFWYLIGGDAIKAVKEFFRTSKFPNGSNKFPLTYLGVNIGANMSRINSWQEFTQKGSRSGLKHTERMRIFFLGAELEERKITWVSWKSVMAEKQYGGLGVTIYGPNGSLDEPIPRHSGGSVWVMICKSIDSLKSKGVDLMQFCNKVIGNLQKDISVAHKLQLSDCFSSVRRRSRGGLEKSQWNEMAQVLDTVILSSFSDRWRWTLNGNGCFSVSSTRKEIDKYLLAMSSSSTRWSKVLPINVNVFIWRMFLDKLLTRSNLSARGMDVPGVLCLVCDSEVESRNHLFFRVSFGV